MNTIQESWESYRKEVVPTDAPAVQIAETKRGFYAGAASIVALLTDIGEEDISEEAGVAMLQGIREECLLFVEHLEAGGAC